MRTILVADDHDDTREIIRLVLELDGWRVVEANNGLTAIERALAEAPDLLLLDEMMPGATGSEVLRYLRTLGLRVPALLVTATCNAPTMDPGFAAVVHKPFAVERLQAVVAGVLGAPPPAAATRPRVPTPTTLSLP